MTIDHVRPFSSNGEDIAENLVACCKACNSFTSRMEFEGNLTAEEIIQKKKERVAERRKEFFQFWSEHVSSSMEKHPGYKP
jgi:HNH endonuclease.